MFNKLLNNSKAIFKNIYKDNKTNASKDLKGGMFRIILASIFIHILSLVIPFYTSIYFNIIVPNEAWATMISLSVGALIAILFAAVLKEARTAIGQWYSRRNYNIANDKSLDYINKNHKYSSNIENINRVWLDLPDTIRLSLGYSSCEFVLPMIDFLASIFYFIVIYVIAGYLVIVPISISLIVLFAANKIAKSVIVAEDRLLDINKIKHSYMASFVNGINQIQLFLQATPFTDNLKKSLAKSADETKYISQLHAQLQNVVQSMAQVQTLLLLFVGLVGLVNNDLTTGAVFASLLLTARLSANIGGAYSLILQKHKYNQALKILDDLDNTVKPILSNDKTNQLRNFKNNININNLSHNYGTLNALSGINLSIKPNDIVVVSGDTGSGKSTLLNLISGIIYPQKGTIFYDDLIHSRVSTDDLRKNIAISLQQPIILSGTIASNFLWHGQEQELLAKIASIGLLDFVLKSAVGLGIEIIDNGVNLSAGQKQATSLTRVLIDDASIILLDEPFSALDTKQKTKLTHYLQNNSKNKTIIIVSNDNELMEIANRIVKLQNGIIISNSYKT